MVLIFRRFRTVEKAKFFLVITTIFMYIALIFVKIGEIQNLSEENIISEDIFSCLKKKDNDVLPALDTNIMFPTNSIFFIESSCSYLSWRQACSVESAARTNPTTTVNLLFTTAISRHMFENSIVSTLISLSNIQVARIHIESYAEKTPLYNQLKQSLINKELNMNINDILKYVTIFKYGGTYLSLDVLITDSLQKHQKNWVVKKSKFNISSDMFSFSLNDNGRQLAMLALSILRSHFAFPEKYFSEDAIMQKLLVLWCDSKCKGLQVIGPHHLVPMSTLKNRFHSEKEMEIWKNHKIYAYKTWVRLPTAHGESLSKKIAEKYCPLVNIYYGHIISTL